MLYVMFFFTLNYHCIAVNKNNISFITTLRVKTRALMVN